MQHHTELTLNRLVVKVWLHDDLEQHSPCSHFNIETYLFFFFQATAVFWTAATARLFSSSCQKLWQGGSKLAQVQRGKCWWVTLKLPLFCHHLAAAEAEEHDQAHSLGIHSHRLIDCFYTLQWAGTTHYQPKCFHVHTPLLDTQWDVLANHHQ